MACCCAARPWASSASERSARPWRRGWRRSGFASSSTRAHARGDDRYRDLDDLLAESDIVSLHLPLTSESRHLIDAKRLQRFKPGAILINVSRGSIIDEAAMIGALLSRRLAGAGLDVFEREPIVPAALLGHPRVVLTPHIGGSTADSCRQARLLCAANICAVLRGESPLTPVTHLHVNRSATAR